MAYYHVRVTIQGQRHDDVKTDLDEATLEERFLQPYRTGAALTVNGKTVEWDQVDRILVSRSEVSSAVLIERVRAAQQNSGVISLGGPSMAWRAAARAEDVTDQFITGPPGQERDASTIARTDATSPQEASVATAADTGAVFVVAGRDSHAASAMGAFLRALGLRVIEWEHAVARTGLPNPYVGDVVEAGLRMARAAVVLLSPDDLVRLRGDLVRDDDGPEESETRGQARPNVYYEAGIADAIGRERTVIVEVGKVKSFSDAAGRHVVRYDGSPAMRHTLAARLRSAGLAVDTGGQEWLSAGEMTEILDAARQALGEPDAQGDATVDTSVVARDVDDILAFYRQVVAKAEYDDLTDLEHESLDIVLRAQAALDRYAAESSYAREAEKVRGKEPFERIPVLMAALRAFRRELE